MLAWMGWAILRGRTTLSHQELRQRWVWTQRMEVRELAQARLVRVRGLEWLIAPRLLVKRRNGAIGWFQSADPALLTAFAQRVGEHAGRAMLPPR